MREAVSTTTGSAGQAVQQWGRSVKISQAEVDAFGKLTGDDQYIHTDPKRAKATPLKGTVVQGSFLGAMLLKLLPELRPGETSGRLIINRGFRLKFINPVLVGESVCARLTGRQQVGAEEGASVTAYHFDIAVVGQTDKVAVNGVLMLASLPMPS